MMDREPSPARSTFEPPRRAQDFDPRGTLVAAASREIVELPDGRSQLRLRLGCLEEIEQYVLSWGTHATVAEPAELRTRVLSTVRELSRRYSRQPPAA